MPHPKRMPLALATLDFYFITTLCQQMAMCLEKGPRFYAFKTEWISCLSPKGEKVGGPQPPVSFQVQGLVS